MNSIQARVRSVRFDRGIPPVYTAGITGTGYFGTFGMTSIPVPLISESSVRHQYLYHSLRKVRYGINTGTGNIGKFGMISIPVPLTSGSSVPHQYLYHSLRKVRYGINTGTGNIGKFGTTSIPVPDTSVSSVRGTAHLVELSLIHI